MNSTAWTVNVNHIRDTEQVAQAFAASTVSGLVIGLTGELGSGKTLFVRAYCEALGVDPQQISSPTFVLVNQYSGRFPVSHFDTYRLADLDEFLAIGADELLDSDEVCLVEWADRVTEVLPADRIDVQITSTGESSRQFRFVAGGPRCEVVLQQARELFEAGRTST